MKIRIKGNALRYRLTKSDISGLADNGYLQEQTGFSEQPLIYALKAIEDVTLSARFSGNTVTLFMPRQMVAGLINTAKVGFGAKSGVLQLLVEKILPAWITWRKIRAIIILIIGITKK
jgi:hypothetical protein